MRYDAVFRAGTIGALTLPNRIVMGSMHLGIESARDGGAALAAFYAERAGGPGLMITGGWAVNSIGVGGPDYGCLDDENGLAALAATASAVHARHGKIALQLFHAGRYAPCDPEGNPPVAPSALPSRFSRVTPRPLSEQEIRDTIADFGAAARRARAAGFDALEIMGSEGYLLNQFSSPLTNQRNDRWGGPPHHRRRFSIEVVRAVRHAVGQDFPIIYRLSGADLVAGSSTPEEQVEHAVELAAEGVSALNVAVGWHESPIPTVQAIVPPGVWLRYAAAVKSAVGSTPVITSNRINRIELADQILHTGKIDFVSMARPFLADARLVDKARTGHAEMINICVACNQACIDRSLRGQKVSCMVNPTAVRETEFSELRHGDREQPRTSRTGGAKKRFAVIGGGPAGCEAARALAGLGHSVDLFEAAAELGGQFRFARLVPGKTDYGCTITYFASELDRLGVRVRLGVPIRTCDAPDLADFDGVVIATGTRPRLSRIPNHGHPNVIDFVAAFTTGIRGERITIIGGGGVALDLAHLLTHVSAEDERELFLAEHGLLPNIRPREPSDLSVTLLARGPRFGTRIGRTTRWALIDTITKAGATLLPDVRCERIECGGVLISNDSRERRLVEADCVILAIGQEPRSDLEAAIKELKIPYRIIGGARDAERLDAARATEEGLRAAHELAGLTRSSSNPAPGKPAQAQA